jgi:hypothetical protein
MFDAAFGGAPEVLKMLSPLLRQAELGAVHGTSSLDGGIWTH